MKDVATTERHLVFVPHPVHPGTLRQKLRERIGSDLDFVRECGSQTGVWVSLWRGPVVNNAVTNSRRLVAQVADVHEWDVIGTTVDVMTE